LFVDRDRCDLPELLRYSPHWDFCASNNLSVRRNHVERIGFWDEAFRGWGEEDLDFAYRLFLSGCRPILPIDGPVFAYHLDHPVNQQANYDSLKKNAQYFIRKYPIMAEYRRKAYRLHGIIVPRIKEELEEFLQCNK
jgi:GT2 family glycosyltransferase